MSGTAPELRSLETLVGYMLRRAQVAVSRSFLTRFADLDVRQTQLGVLTVIETSPGLKPSRVGALLGIKRANIGPLLEDLEKRGFVRREQAASDRRSQALFLTESGRDLVAELHRREDAHEALIASQLSASERALLLDLLTRVERACLEGAEDEAADGEGDEAA